MKIFDFEKYGNQYKMQLKVLSYLNGNLAIEMYVNTEDGWEPWNTLTVNLISPLSPNHAYIDTNNNGKMIEAWLVRNKIAVPTGRTASSGYCVYPEYKFRPELLQEADTDGYAEYLALQS